MGKLRKKMKPKIGKDDQLTKNWLNNLPSRAETRRMDYWFKILKPDMQDDSLHPEKVKNIWTLLLSKMVINFPQYKKLQNGDAFETTKLYKSIWRHF